MNNQKYREPKGSLFHTRRVADWTKTLAVVTAALTLVASAQLAVAIRQGYAMDSQMRRESLAVSEQLGEMKAANRPIVAINSIEAGGPVTFDEDGVSLQLKIKLENVGRGTAEFVHAEGDLFSSDGSNMLFSDPPCADRRHQKINDDLGGKAIWRGSSLDAWPILSMDKYNYARWLALWKNGADDQPIWVVGCVDYVFDGQHHQTSFVREVDRTGVDKWNRIDPGRGTVPKRAVILLQHPAIAEVSD